MTMVVFSSESHYSYHFIFFSPKLSSKFCFSVFFLDPCLIAITHRCCCCWLLCLLFCFLLILPSVSLLFVLFTSSPSSSASSSDSFSAFFVSPKGHRIVTHIGCIVQLSASSPRSSSSSTSSFSPMICGCHFLQWLSPLHCPVWLTLSLDHDNLMNSFPPFFLSSL